MRGSLSGSPRQVLLMLPSCRRDHGGAPDYAPIWRRRGQDIVSLQHGIRCNDATCRHDCVGVAVSTIAQRRADDPARGYDGLGRRDWIAGYGQWRDLAIVIVVAGGGSMAARQSVIVRRS